MKSGNDVNLPYRMRNCGPLHDGLFIAIKKNDSFPGYVNLFRVPMTKDESIPETTSSFNTSKPWTASVVMGGKGPSTDSEFLGSLCHLQWEPGMFVWIILCAGNICLAW